MIQLFFLMDIGVAIAVFLTLSLLLLVLFCFVTRYFHHKHKVAIEENIQIYSMVDDVNNESLEGISNQYNQFNKNKQTNQKSKMRDNEIFIELSDMKSPLMTSTDGGAFQNRKLLKRLNGEIIPTNKLQSARQMSQLKMFQPDKLITTNRKDRNKEQNQQNNEKPTPKHTFISKLICYDSHGIHIYDVIMISIKKVEGDKIKQNKKIKFSQISTTDSNFENQLQILGFEKGEYSCYKYQSMIEMNDFRLNEDYMIKNLKISQSKEMIQIQEFVKLKLKLQSS